MTKILTDSILSIPKLQCEINEIKKLLDNTNGTSGIISIDSVSFNIDGKLIIYYTDTNGSQTIETDTIEKFIIKYNVLNYTELLTITPELYDYAYVRESQGTKWLPGFLGGIYYPNGLYYYNGTEWLS